MKTFVLNNRDLGIEALKAFAAILVMNSHMSAMYGKYAFLATGGAIGDALFFFCSGYTLFLGKIVDFPNWYKRRIQRIYPTVIVMSLLFAHYHMDQIQYVIKANLGSGWFISCIFIYYAILYPIRKYFSSHLNLVLCFVGVITVLWYIFIGVEPKSACNIYGATFFKYCFFFMYMLFGAICGKKYFEKTTKIYRSMISLLATIVSVVAFYGIYVYTKQNNLESIQLLSLLPLFGVCYFLWNFCESDFMIKVVHKKIIGPIILFIGGLCLEVYLAQGLVFTTKLNCIFPLNIPLIMIGVIIVAYFVRSLSRFLLQTFQQTNYDWKAILRLI